MDVLRINKKNILLAVYVLRSGGVIVYPTDTAYALGGIYNNKKVIERILRIKKRRDKKFTIIASSLNQAQKFFPFHPWQRRLGKKYWPGPLSIIVSKNYAVRVPKHPLARKLARGARAPIIATSANISGKKNTYSIQEFLKQLKPSAHLLDIILDSGKLKKRKPSTIVRVSADGRVRILRKGSISGLRRQSY